MKKAFAIIIISVIFICGCGNGDIKNKFALPLELTASLNGKDYFIQRITQEGYILSFDKEHPLFGLNIEIWGDKGTATVADFVCPVESGYFPAQHCLARAVRLLNERDISAVKTKKGFKYTIDETVILVYYDNDTKQVIGIEAEENGRRFYFSVRAITPYEKPSNGEG